MAKIETVRRKLLITGDGACGKTSLVNFFALGKFIEGYMFENHIVDVEVDGKHVELALWDTPGQEDFDRLRPLSYPNSHVILIAFAVDNPDSLANVEEMWLPEAFHCAPGVPIVLVGCKMDLRNQPWVIEELRRRNQRPTTPEEGRRVAQSIDARQYFECSAKTGEGVHDVFHYATRVTLLSPIKKKGLAGLNLFFDSNVVRVIAAVQRNRDEEGVLLKDYDFVHK